MHWMLSQEPEKPVLIVPLMENHMSRDEFLNRPDFITWLRSMLAVTYTEIQNVNIMIIIIIICRITAVMVMQ